DQLFEACEVFIAYSAKAVCELLCIGDFRTNQAEGVNKWKTDEFLPFLAEVPELKFTYMLLPEANGLIADEKLRATRQLEHRHVACVPSGDVLRCLQSSGLQTRSAHRLKVYGPNQARFQASLGEQAAQETQRSLRCGIEFYFLDLGNLVTMCDYDTVNGAVR